MNRHREELRRLYDSAFSHISNVFMPDFDRFVECVLDSDFSCFKPGEKMIWGDFPAAKGVDCASAYVYDRRGGFRVDRKSGGEYMHKCGGVQEEDYKFNSIVILDSGKLGCFLSRFPRFV